MNEPIAQTHSPRLLWRRILSSRLVPLVLLTVAAVLIAIAWATWISDEGAMQQRNLATLAYGGIAIIGCFAWFVALAPAAWQLRRNVLLMTIAIGAAAATYFKIESVDGDFWPIISRRWAPTPDRMMEPVKVTTRETPKQDDAKATGLEGLSDSPQFLGPNRTGVIDGVKLNGDWQSHPPRLLWKRAVGAAWSGFAVAGRSAITQEQRGEDELVVCYDIATGQPLWSHADETRYDTTIAGIGPRATPTIMGERVFTLGATGILNCLDLATGKRHWTIDVLKDTDGPLLDWGAAGSPLVEGDACIINTGGKQGAVAAYNVTTGKRRWIAGEGATSYASPCIIKLLGTRQLVMQNQFTITGHALDDGRALWSHSTPGGHPKVAQPLPLGGDRLLVSSGYGTGSEAFQLVRDENERITTKSLWKNVYLKSKFANLVLRDGHVYGLNDGTLTCLKADTGERAWRGERYGHGQLLLVGDVLLIQAEAGDVVLVEATPKDFRELSRFTAFDEKTWNSPTLAGRYLLVRNDREAACFELP